MRVAFFLPSVLLVIILCPGAMGALQGHITDRAGHPITNARIVAEPGIEAAVVEGSVHAEGRFSFENDFYGNVGLIAWAPGYSFGGIHLSIAAGDQPDNLRIALAKSVGIAGQITDIQGAPVANARITSLAITHPFKVGIPLFKLGGVGVSVPTSDSEGRFIIEGVPEGARAVLKFEHPSYAQEAVPDVAAGENALGVVMHRGVSLRGQVTIRGTDTPVSGALVTVRNAQPPHDTAFSNTDGSGIFNTLLKPGVYLLQAYAAGRMSPGLQRITLRGDLPEQHARLSLSQKGVVAGTIHDAKSGAPIPGVRVLLETQNQPAGATRTSKDGRFRLEAAEGVNTLHFEGVEGYMPPDTRALRVTVPGNGELELPGLWLAPMPDYVLRVVESDGETPVPGAFVSLLWPRQFGWQRSDGNGNLTIRFGTLPADNRILGFVEHPEKPLGALFSLEQQRLADASVALLPLAKITGRVLNEQGTPLPGVTVGALFADDRSEALTLWRTVTDWNGAFSWPSAPAGVPQRCIATVGKQHRPFDRDFNPAPGEHIDLGAIMLTATALPHAPAVLDTWIDMPLLCGPRLVRNASSGLVAFYCDAAEAQTYIDAAMAMREQLRTFNLETLVAVNGPFECDEAPLPVYQSEGASAATRMYDHNGHLYLEAIGLPPVHALRQLAAE